MRFREYNHVAIDAYCRARPSPKSTQDTVICRQGTDGKDLSSAPRPETTRQSTPSSSTPTSTESISVDEVHEAYDEYVLSIPAREEERGNNSKMDKEDGSQARLTWSKCNRSRCRRRHRRDYHHYDERQTFNPRQLSSIITAKIQQVCRDLFLPIGYPNSVAPGYLEYQMYDSLQGLCSYLRGVVSTSAVLAVAGVGDADATAMSAAVTWAIRDGLGMIGGLIYSYLASPYFDAYVKEFRLLADIFNDFGLTLDMAMPFLLSLLHPLATSPNPSSSTSSSSSGELAGELLGNTIGGSASSSSSSASSSSTTKTLLLLTSLSTLCKVACGISAGATKSNISQHFATSGNLADVNAKESSQETLVSLVGMVIGVVLARWLHSLEHGDNIDRLINDDYCVVDSSQENNVDTCNNDNSKNTMMALWTDVQFLSWTIFLTLTIIHVWANYIAVKKLRLRTLNQERASVSLHPLLEQCGSWVLKMVEIDSIAVSAKLGGKDGVDDDHTTSNTSSTNDELLPLRRLKKRAISNIRQPDQVCESLWKSACGMIIPKNNVHLGIRLHELIRYSSSSISSLSLSSSSSSSSAWTSEQWEFIQNEFQYENYMVFDNIPMNPENYQEGNNTQSRRPNHNPIRILVLMRMGAKPCDELKAFIHAHLLQWCHAKNECGVETSFYSSWTKRKMLLSRSHEIVQCLSQSGIPSPSFNNVQSANNVNTNPIPAVTNKNECNDAAPHENDDDIDLWKALSDHGWDMTRLYLGFSPWRCEWEDESND